MSRRLTSSSVKKPRGSLSSKGYQVVSTPLRPRNDSTCEDMDLTSSSRVKNKGKAQTPSTSSIQDELECDMTHTFESSDGDASEESDYESLVNSYEEYLLSKLLLVVAEAKKKETEVHVKQEVSNMISTLQTRQAQSKAAKDAERTRRSAEAKAKIFKRILSAPISDLETSAESIHQLALALESRHSHLKVEGLPLFSQEDGPEGDPKVLVQDILALLSSLKHPQNNYPNIHSLAHDFESLEKHLGGLSDSWNEFQGKSRTASNILSRLESLKLSLQEEANKEEYESLLKINVPSPLNEEDI